MNYRHGDINFHGVEAGEAGGERVSHDGTFVVGLGETTGHRHVLSVARPEDMEIMSDADGNHYFRLLAEGTLTHEEHRTIKMPPGTYRKFQEEEVDWFAEGVTRKVID